MSRTLGIVGTRGGVGTTTVALHLAHAWERDGKEVVLSAGGLQAADLALLKPHLSFLGDQARLELATHGSAPLTGAEVNILDLPAGCPPEFDLDALVIVAQPRPTSLAAVWEIAAQWQGQCPLFLLVGGSPWPSEGKAVARRLVAACAANHSLGLTVLPSWDRSFLLSRAVVSGRTAFDIAPFLPVAKVVDRTAQILMETDTESSQVDLNSIRSERAA